jgi:hypothetical protein
MVDIISAFTPSPGRVMQLGLALYLLPAVLVVLVVSALGILVLAARELFCDSIWDQIWAPQARVGQENFRL